MPWCFDAFMPSLRFPVLIIDTYNVLHAASATHEGLSGLNLATLIRLLTASRWSGGPALLICDGSGGRSAVPDGHLHPEAPIRVVFAGPGKDADSAIERMIIDAEHRAGRAGGSGITVVSSDKRVLAAAIGPVGPKARRMTSEQFLKALLDDARRSGMTDPSRPDTLDKESVADWVRRFGVQAPGVKDVPKDPAAERRGTHGTKPEDWPEGINPDDLDMAKWLNEPPRK
jgi:predicted RNA-binding protein with PIN domain